MSLIQFLSVTRTFGMVRDAPTRFKMKQENLLPKFGNKPGAVETVLHAEKPEKEVHGSSALKTEEKIKGPAGKAGAQQKMRPEDLEQSKKPEAMASGSSPRMGWTLLGIFKRLVGGKPSRPARKRGPVQAELGLDMVRPVRNDLNDSDLELITVQKPLPDVEPSSTLVKTERPVHSTAKPRRARISSQRNVFSPPQESEAGPTASPELACAGKSDLVGAWWGRLRTGLSKITNKEH
jgi:hypothetical protein